MTSTRHRGYVAVVRSLQRWVPIRMFAENALLSVVTCGSLMQVYQWNRGHGVVSNLSKKMTEIDISNHALRICYKKYSRLTKYVDLPEEYRKEFMRRCLAEQIDKLRDKLKNDLAIEGRKTFEELQRERNLERLESIKMFREYDEALRSE